MVKKQRKLYSNQSGQGMTEYILIVALIAVLAIGAIKFFGTNTAASFTSAAGATGAAVGQGTAASGVGGIAGTVAGH